MRKEDIIFDRTGITTCPECGNNNTVIILNPVKEKKIVCWDCNKIFDMLKSNPEDITSKSGMKFRKLG